MSSDSSWLEAKPGWQLGCGGLMVIINWITELGSVMLPGLAGPPTGLEHSEDIT